MTRLATVALAFLHAFPVSAAPPPSLFVIQDLPDPGGSVARRALVRVRLDPDHHCFVETIVTKDQRFFGHFGGHYLWDDRYVATRSGGVIDISSQRVIHDFQDGSLLGFEP